MRFSPGRDDGTTGECETWGRSLRSTERIGGERKLEVGWGEGVEKEKS